MLYDPGAYPEAAIDTRITWRVKNPAAEPKDEEERKQKEELKKKMELIKRKVEERKLQRGSGSISQ